MVVVIFVFVVFVVIDLFHAPLTSFVLLLRRFHHCHHHPHYHHPHHDHHHNRHHTHRPPFPPLVRHITPFSASSWRVGWLRRPSSWPRILLS